MRQSPSNANSGMRSGKFLEGALLGRLRNTPENTIADSRLNLKNLMQGIRERQSENPASPQRPFLKNLVVELGDYLDNEFDIDPDQYEVRVYSAVDTPLDARGVDFWVELVDLQNGKVLSDYKVDLTTNSEKNNPRGLADAIYHYDTELEEEFGAKSVYEGIDFKALVESAASNLFSRSGLQRAH